MKRERPPRITSKKSVTPSLTPQRNDRGNTTDRGYGSQWQKARAVMLNAEPLCRRCASFDLVTAACHVDHIIPIALGGDNSYENMQPLCFNCHARKTVHDVARIKSTKRLKNNAEMSYGDIRSESPHTGGYFKIKLKTP